MKNFKPEEIELLKTALEFLRANLAEAEEATDTNIDVELLKGIEDKIYESSL